MQHHISCVLPLLAYYREVASELRSVSDRMLLSEQLVPGVGFNYS